MSAKFKSVALSAVMMAGLLAAGAASAQIAVGGGATLPEILYDEILPSGVGLTDFTYTGTGSGAGKTAFYNNNATVFDNESLSPAPTAAVPLPNPWPATQSVHFAGSDSAVTSTELSNYNTVTTGTPASPLTRLAAWGPLIQIPAVATSVLIPYKRTGISNLDLTDAKMCAIFSKKSGGQTWGQVRGTTDTTAVQVVYRTDTSGTTELLSRYLVAACPGSGFVVSNSFATMVAGALPSGTTLATTGWLGVNGSGGMSGAFGTNGRIGYLSPDSTYTGSSNAVVSKINGNLPVASSIKAVLGAVSLPVGGASQASNPLAWVPAYAKPASGYPIFGTTNLLVNQCYKDAAVQAKIKAFLVDLFGTTYDAQITAHNFVNLPDGTAGTNNWKAAVASTFLDASSNLGIGNTNVCNGIGRPLSN
ncbi:MULTISPECIES: substrate-binding domain-containing protein [Variovorax]|uniref:substrate-binding domain-containing protein n=1 Tax=Variovorax sp. TaxID=1871043 RepID=UPI003BA8B0FB